MGRPKGAGLFRSKPLNIRLHEQEKKKLKAMGKTLTLSMNEVMRRKTFGYPPFGNNKEPEEG